MRGLFFSAAIAASPAAIAACYTHGHTHAAIAAYSNAARSTYINHYV